MQVYSVHIPIFKVGHIGRFDVISRNRLRVNLYTIKRSVNRSPVQGVLKECFQSQERKMLLLYPKW